MCDSGTAPKKNQASSGRAWPSVARRRINNSTPIRAIRRQAGKEDQRQGDCHSEDGSQWWKKWATERLTRYYGFLDFLFSPDLLVVGGGVSRKSEKFLPLLELRAPIVPAQLRNEAGIIGAAWYAEHHG